jgi:hypothetical protein
MNFKIAWEEGLLDITEADHDSPIGFSTPLSVVPPVPCGGEGVIPISSLFLSVTHLDA